jgi:hypothetical protein
MYQHKLCLFDLGLPTVYLPSCRDLEVQQTYEAMGVLYDGAGQIEKHVFFKKANLPKLTVDLIF